MPVDALIHGNFHGYYNSRSFHRDPRLALVPKNLFSGATVLDIGCNEGWVTCEIAQLYDAAKVIGVDIDDTLVRAAWRRRRTVWSRQAPRNTADGSRFPVQESAADLEPTRKKLKVNVNDVRMLSLPDEPVADHFPAAMEHMFGPLPIPSSPSDHFPHNVIFRTADWAKDGVIEDPSGYDVVLAFSVTKWIHLNGGDEALQGFFRRIAGCLRIGGVLVMEEQDWTSYIKAKRVHESFRAKAQALNTRPEDFPDLLLTMGFESQDLGTPTDPGFNRRVLLYRKVRELSAAEYHEVLERILTKS